jgi:hypothetical protein
MQRKPVQISRRSFIMVSSVAAAAGLVVLVPVLLRPRSGSTRSAGSTLGNLTVISRAEWGAVEPDLVTSDERPYDAVSNRSGWMVYEGPLDDALDTIIVHHSALPLSDGPREIQALHMNEKRFADVGYHFMIDEAGRVYEGRALNVRGAHTGGYNTGAIGIMLMGNFDEIEPTQVQLDQLVALTSILVRDYSIANLAGHRDYNPGLTQCPGDSLALLLPDLAAHLNVRFGT